MLGFGSLGQFAIGQSWQNGRVVGAIFDIQMALVSGTAIGGSAGDANANGVLFEINTSFTSGVAIGIREPSIFGGIGTAQFPIHGRANGKVLYVRAEVIGGRARGQKVSLLAGSAHSDAFVIKPDTSKPVTLLLYAGSPKAEQNLHDDELLLLLEAA